MGYIYMITNTANGKSYIGQTVNDPITRIKLHFAGRVGSRSIVNDIKEHGAEKFTYQILHKDIDPELLDSLEIKAITKHNTLRPYGYNQIDGGGGRSPAANSMKRNKMAPGIWDKHDNKFFLEKTRIRSQLLKKLTETPVICETHGGVGELFLQCYRGVLDGVVFENDPKKSVKLLRQRPTWQICESDCVFSLKNGVGSHLPINFIDCDPYGAAWDVLQAFFSSEREFVQKMIVVVHDGVKVRLKRYGGTDMRIFDNIIEEIGDTEIYEQYLEVCGWLLTDMSAVAGYEVSQFGGFYSQRDEHHTHFFAELTQSKV